MKLILKKDWHFTGIGGKDVYKKGTVLYSKNNAKRLPVYNYSNNGLVEEGWCMSHFYCYGQNEIIPNEYLKIIK